MSQAGPLDGAWRCIELAVVGIRHVAWNPGTEAAANYRGFRSIECNLEREPTRWWRRLQLTVLGKCWIANARRRFRPLSGQFEVGDPATPERLPGVGRTDRRQPFVRDHELHAALRLID